MKQFAMSNTASPMSATTKTILAKARREKAAARRPPAALTCAALQGSRRQYTREAGRVHRARARHLDIMG